MMQSSLTSALPWDYAFSAGGVPWVEVGVSMKGRTTAASGFFASVIHSNTPPLWAVRVGSLRARRFLFSVRQPARVRPPDWRRESGKFNPLEKESYMKANSPGVSAPVSLSNNPQLVSTINELCETTYVVQFLRGTFAREEGEKVTLSVKEVYGLSNVLEDLANRIEKAVRDLAQLEGACHD